MKDEKTFKTQDRRPIDEKGEMRKDLPDEKESDKKQNDGDSPQEEKTDERREPLQINFETFVVSIHTSAMMYLGTLPNPIDGTKKKDLPLAKQNIDILEMLQDKTKGNLSNDEEKLLSAALYDVRMKYIEQSKNSG